jgi:ParB-like nuclease domain
VTAAPAAGRVTPLGQVQWRPLAEIRPYPANARKISRKAVEQTAKSLAEFGWQQPMVTDAELVLVVGHVRHAAALSLGETHGPVVVASHLSAAQLRAYRIADNRTHDYTTWDYSVLAPELGGLEDFADVLDLADWQAIIRQFEQASADADQLLTDPAALASLGAKDTVTVVFATQAEAQLAGQLILDQIPGVVDVRYSFRSAGHGAASSDQRGQASPGPAADSPAAGPAGRGDS